MENEPEVEKHIVYEKEESKNHVEEEYQDKEPALKKVKRASKPRAKKKSAVETVIETPLSEYEKMNPKDLFTAFTIGICKRKKRSSTSNGCRNAIVRHSTCTND